MPNEITSELVGTLLDRLESLENKITEIEKLLTVSNLTVSDIEIKFLLEEFGQLGEFWRHTDSRIETGLNLYLTISALVVSALLIFLQRITDITFFFSVTAIFALGLAIAGFVLAKRIISAYIIKEQYIFALNLLRRYFVDNAPRILPYLFLPFTKNPAIAIDDLQKPVISRGEGILINGIHLWVSTLFGVAVTLTIYLATGGIVSSILGGVIAILVSFVYLRLSMRSYLKERANYSVTRLKNRQPMQ